MPVIQTIRRYAPGSLVAGLAAYGALSAAALSTPLVSDPGYEFGGAIAVGASLLAGLLTIGAASSRGPWDPSGENALQPHHAIARLVGRQLALATLPLLIALPTWWITSGCGPHDALAWYTILVLPSAALSTALAVLSLSLSHRTWSRLALFLLLWSGSIIRGGYEAFSGPHIFLFAWPVGYFPGGSWETSLPVPDVLLPYRLFSLAVGIGVCQLSLTIQQARRANWKTPSIRSLALIVCGLAVVAWMWLGNREAIGLTRTYSSLHERLHDTLRLRYGTLHFRRSGVDTLDLFDAGRIVDSSVWDQCRLLGIDPNVYVGTDVYLYSGPDEEREMVGVPTLAFTKPWQRTVHIQASDVRRALRHELAHVVLAPYGFVIGLPLSQGMLEGSAVALEGETGWRTRREYVRRAYDAGIAPSAADVLSVGGFTSVRPQLAYRLSGAFNEWLISTYGPRRFLDAFSQGNLRSVYGLSDDSLSARFRQSLNDIRPADSTELVATRYLFAGVGFFHQRCLRRIGRLNSEGDELLDGGEYERAIERYRSSLEEGLNAGARTGMLRALWSLGRWNELLDSISHYTSDSTGITYLASEIEWGDALWGVGNLREAQRHYQKIFTLDISRHLTLRAALRLRFINSSHPLRDIMQTYFSRPMSLETRWVVLNNAIRLAESANDRFLLRLMLASLTVRRSPITTLGSLADMSIGDAYPSGVQPEGPLAYLFAVRELARDIKGAVVYSRVLHPSSVTFDPDALVEKLGCDQLPMPSRHAAAWSQNAN